LVLPKVCDPIDGIVQQHKAYNSGYADETTQPEYSDDGNFAFPVYAQSFDDRNGEAEYGDVEEDGESRVGEIPGIVVKTVSCFCSVIPS